MARYSHPYVFTGELAIRVGSSGYDLRRELVLLQAVHARRKLRLPGDFDGLEKLQAALPGLLSTVAALTAQCETYCGDQAPDGLHNCAYGQYTCDTARRNGSCVCGLPGGEPQEAELPNVDDPFYPTGRLAVMCADNIARYLDNAAEISIVMNRRTFRGSNDPARVLHLKQQLVGVTEAAQQLAVALSERL